MIHFARFGLLAASLVVGFFATTIMWPAIVRNQASVADMIAISLLFVLTSWTALWFGVSVIGFALVLWNPKREPLKRRIHKPNPFTHTAILLPVYNEDTTLVFAGLQAMRESLGKTGQADHFDFFLLSDSTNPDIWLAEEKRWRQLCRASDGLSKVYYRHRRVNTGRKAGNIADFCKRWGAAYDFMIPLDADSLVEGELLLEMVRQMEANPQLGILQTPPLPLGSSSLLSRSQQFISRLCGPILSRGFAWLTGADGNYWGHNAIIRTAAFTRYCGLSELPGQQPLGGEILSHDFVEAALMRRAGYEVRLATDLVGSYEQSPTTLPEYAQRDQRWCQGNMQHTRLIVSRFIAPMNRFHFFTGMLAYVSSPLWMLFLFVSPLAFWGMRTRHGFDDPSVWSGIALFAGIMTLLLLPRLFGLIVALGNAEARRGFGGTFRLMSSTAFELVLSVLLAPIMMAFHTLFVFTTLQGKRVEWNSQHRTEEGLSWGDAWRVHRGQTFAGIALAALAYLLSPTMLLWLAPIVTGLVFSIPLSIFISSSAWGDRFRRLGLLQIPEETDVPDIISRFQYHLRHSQTPSRDPRVFEQFLLDPQWIGDHIVSLQATQGVARANLHTLQRVRWNMARQRCSELSPADKLALLSDPNALHHFHFRAWSTLRDGKAESHMRN